MRTAEELDLYVKMLNMLIGDAEIRELAFKKIIEDMDTVRAIEDAREEGRKEGFEEGRKKGIKEAEKKIVYSEKIQEARSEGLRVGNYMGKLEGKRDLLNIMVENNVPVQQIADMIGMSVPEVEELRVYTPPLILL